MTKIDIFSGFLGAGKTTLIKKLISEAYTGEKLVLIENEFGEIGIDGGFLKDAGVEITEMNSGCICCSLVGDFSKALSQVISEFKPDRILIEPSGVGKLSDVINAAAKVVCEDVVLNSFATVVDANKCKMYLKNFGEFFSDQVKNAGVVILSRTNSISHEKLDTCLQLIRELNPNATIVTTDWSLIDGKQILAAMEQKNTLKSHLEHLKEEHHHHHHHHDNEECCCCHDHHDHDHEHHHEHHHDHERCDHEHHHEHHHDHEHCHCHDHEHKHHHEHHHADDVFTSWGIETARVFTKQEIESALNQLDNTSEYGIVLRAKGIVAGDNGEWIYFDFVPGEISVRNGETDITGRLCVIGSNLNTKQLEKLFA